MATNGHPHTTTGTCPSCGKRTHFKFLGMQTWTFKPADALYECESCFSSLIESNILDQPTAEELCQYFENLPERKQAAVDDFVSSWEKYSNRGKDTPRSRWEAHQVSVSSAGAKVLAARRAK